MHVAAEAGTAGRSVESKRHNMRHRHKTLLAHPHEATYCRKYQTSQEQHHTEVTHLLLLRIRVARISYEKMCDFVLSFKHHDEPLAAGTSLIYDM